MWHGVRTKIVTDGPKELGYFAPNFDLIEEKLREEGLDNTSQYRELNVLTD